MTQTDGKGTISVAAPFLSNEETEQRNPERPAQALAARDRRLPGHHRRQEGRPRSTCEANRGEVNDIVSATLTSASGSFTYDVKPRQ